MWQNRLLYKYMSEFDLLACPVTIWQGASLYDPLKVKKRLRSA